MQVAEKPTKAPEKKRRFRFPLGSALRDLDINTRLLGMVVSLVVIWVGMHILSGGTFLRPRNLFNLSLQTSVVAIMATGMVLVIVSRNIDLSVGSVLGAVGMAMALVQAEILPDMIGFDHPATWIITLVVGLVLGAAIGGFHGFIIAYVGVPSFIVTLGGLLVWRGVAWALSSGRTIAPMDSTFQLIGGGSRGTLGATASWAVAGVACLAIVTGILMRRRQRRAFGFKIRPKWADAVLAGVGCGSAVGAAWVMNSNYVFDVPVGIANPVLLTIGVALVMTFIATRRSFGRYVFAIGGNPEAAELGGIKTRWTIMKTFILMGVLVGLAAAVSIARLNAAVTGQGQLSELYVIAAAVIGGASLSGGIGTVSGAVLGALIMQSLQSGMVLMGVDAPLQDIVVGIVLVVAVAIDTIYRRRAT
ncbi:MAG: sugar ABC transporter permease [Acidimicrobiia bacterium]